MKKRFSIAALITVLVLILIFTGVFIAYSAFGGNPVTKLTFTSKAKAYVSEKWPEAEFKVSKAVYDFKTCSYSCHVQSLDSKDTAFSVYRIQSGEVRDSYEADVVKRGRTIARLSRDLDIFVEEKLLPDFNRRVGNIYCSFYDLEEIDDSKFQLDMDFTPDKMPYPVTLYMSTETKNQEPTWEELAEVLKEVVSYTESKGIDIKYYCITLDYPYEVNEKEQMIPSKGDSEIRSDYITKDVIKGGDLNEHLKNRR